MMMYHPTGIANANMTRFSIVLNAACNIARAMEQNLPKSVAAPLPYKETSGKTRTETALLNTAMSRITPRDSANDTMMLTIEGVKGRNIVRLLR